MRTLALLNLTFLALAQSPAAEPEIRGTLTEFGVREAIAGAQVIVSEFVVVDSTLTRKPISTIYADSRGGFTYKPGHIGQFWVEAHRDGYTTPQAGSTFVIGIGVSETSVDLTQERPVSNTNLMLFRPGSLTGRVVDEEGKPVAKLVVTLIQPNVITPPITANTNDDGNFTFTGLPASSRVIQLGPAPTQALEIMETFTDEDLAAVDQDYAVSYWPGGSREPEQALPVQVTPGATVNLGTLRVRKVPYYRALLKYEGECTATENWALGFPVSTSTVILPILRPTKCRKEILVRKLRPGSKELAINSGTGPSRKAAVVALNIRDENVEAAFNFSPSENVPVRLIDRNGGQLPKINDARLSLRTSIGFGEGADLNEKDPAIQTFILPRQQIVFAPSNVAIQEIRYNRFPVLDGYIDVVRGATLEIVLDQRPAILSFSAPVAGAIVFLAKWPLAESLAVLETRPPWTAYRVTDGLGKGQFRTLAAGEYRLVTIPPAAVSQVRNPQTLLEMLAHGEKITLERGEQKSIEIKR